MMAWVSSKLQPCLQSRLAASLPPKYGAAQGKIPSFSFQLTRHRHNIEPAGCSRWNAIPGTGNGGAGPAYSAVNSLSTRDMTVWGRGSSVTIEQTSVATRQSNGRTVRSSGYVPRPRSMSCTAQMAASEPAGRPLIEIEKVVRGLSFEAAREVLQAPPYGLKVKESAVLPELYLVAYDMLRIIREESSWEQPVVRQARGMILEKGTYRVVCRPFDKFFNSKEAGHKKEPVDWTSARVYEKVDGSLIKCYFYKGEWRVATNGTIAASEAPARLGSARTFQDVFRDTWPHFPAGLHPDYTYMFELCHPETRVIVPHQRGQLVYLGARHLPSHREVFPEDLPVPGLDPPRRYELTSEKDCLEMAAKMPFSKEGFVAVDAQFRRAKIKSPAYVWLAHAGSNPQRDIRNVFFKVLLQGETSEASLLPGIGPLFEPFEEALEELLDRVLQTWYKLKDIEVQKDFALTLQKEYPHVMSMFFNLRKEAQRRANSENPSTLSDAEVKRYAMEHWLTSQDDGATVKAALAFGVTLPEISEAVANEFYKHQEAALDDEAVA